THRVAFYGDHLDLDPYRHDVTNRRSSVLEAFFLEAFFLEAFFLVVFFDAGGVGGVSVVLSGVVAAGGAGGITLPPPVPPTSALSTV
ncbi:MAG: hypothetical protein ACNS61_12035, partial [Candidatus Wenzhouxiangella sp. M2_3B_020]